MTIIHPLLASRSAPDYRQCWRLAGVWRRAINLMTESGELLTLHRQGSGFGPGGWVLRSEQFDALRGELGGNEQPQVVAQGIRLGRFTVKQPQRYVAAYYAACASSTACSCMDATCGGNRAFWTTGDGGKRSAAR